ncbi:hypothetical protein [Massilia sp. GCM10023247]|uniref:hypothetical protein n=1 Tax=Massilia sp. GCM10023247 TaxID=3252643 RepID=UPI003620D6EF
MRKPLRLFFMCLLIASLPMRSMAGVVTAECDMDHPVAPASVDHGAMSGHAMAEPGTHDAGHEAAGEHAAPAAQAELACDECGAGGGVPGAPACGTCAECCVGACAPPPPMAVTAVEEVISSLQHFSLSSFTGHIPARIERPPSLT